MVFAAATCVAVSTDGATSDPGLPPPADLDRLGDEIAELAAHLHAATYRLLVLLREFDERGGWGVGFRSCAEWLSWRVGLAAGAAREKVRVARALHDLPALSAAMARGSLSYSKVRALTRVATPANEAELLEIAQCATAAHVERIVRAWRRCDRVEETEHERERHAARELRLFVDDDGSYVIRGRLDPEVGALLEQALAFAHHFERCAGDDRAAQQRPIDAALRAIDAAPQPIGAAHEPVDPAQGHADAAQRRADAIGWVAALALASGSRPIATSPAGGHAQRRAGGVAPRVRRAERFQVVLHVDAEALGEESKRGHAVIAGGARVSAETSRRLACDASRVIMTHDRSGAVLDVGRRTRTVPPSIRRALEHRDEGGCRFPGCGHRICDAHHVRHWADGGATRLDNLVLLCRYHHRAVHEEGYRIECSEPGVFRFVRPDGAALPAAPAMPRLDTDAVGALRQAHAARGILPDAWTTTPHWRGERLDLDWTMRLLRRG